MPYYLLLTAHAVDPITVTVDEFSIMHAVWAQCLPPVMSKMGGKSLYCRFSLSLLEDVLLMDMFIIIMHLHLRDPDSLGQFFVSLKHIPDTIL